ncbi:hypothetical protein AbraIFM66950_011370 [Aspergillus brasiliensis]|nr:hypothetical protein AbraIFM66950_011370 [Aspergillus brasiliensis]
MSNIILLPLPKLNFKLPLSEYGMDSMLSAELRQYIFNSMGVDVPFLTLMDSTTSVLSVAGIVVEELGKVAGREDQLAVAVVVAGVDWIMSKVAWKVMGLKSTGVIMNILRTIDPMKFDYT